MRILSGSSTVGIIHIQSHMYAKDLYQYFICLTATVGEMFGSNNFRIVCHQRCLAEWCFLKIYFSTMIQRPGVFGEFRVVLIQTPRKSDLGPARSLKNSALKWMFFSIQRSTIQLSPQKKPWGYHSIKRNKSWFKKSWQNHVKYVWTSTITAMPKKHRFFTTDRPDETSAAPECWWPRILCAPTCDASDELCWGRSSSTAGFSWWVVVMWWLFMMVLCYNNGYIPWLYEILWNTMK